MIAEMERDGDREGKVNYRERVNGDRKRMSCWYKVAFERGKRKNPAAGRKRKRRRKQGCQSAVT